MDSGLRVEIPQDHGKFVTVVVQGYLTGDTAITLVSAESLNPRPKFLIIDTITFAIQEKMGVLLLWGRKGSEPAYEILPLESRGRVDLSGSRVLRSPKDWDGTLVLRAFNHSLPPEAERKHILLVLQMEKQ